MLAAIFSCRGLVLATSGNLNNHIGVPLTLARLRAAHQAAIIEMGANHHGEIALLARLARPTIGVVTHAGMAHLEGFGSREGVARAKGELYAGLDSGGLAVINADDIYADLWRGLAGHCRQISFGTEKPADIAARNIREVSGKEGGSLEFDLVTPAGQTPVALPMVGRHNVMNALAAAACAWGAGIEAGDIARGLAAMQQVSGRLVPRRALRGAQLIDDTYNANPTSVQAAIGVLGALPGQRWLVLGDMGELGPEAREWHRRAGEWAKEQKLDRLYAVGEMSREAAAAFGPQGRHFGSHAELSASLAPELTPDTTVLVKGSRSMQMEKIVSALLAPGEASVGVHGEVHHAA
jgi:UDP-N-acetylmuramoyl-tripeptide--D-alanyl-D-alanine ligase